MLKQRVIGVILGIVLIAAVAGTSANVVSSLIVSNVPVGQAIACNTGSGSGGGC